MVLKDKLDDDADDHTHTLSNLLHRSAVLIEREAEDLWLRYKRQRAVNETLRKLLDAKTHLYYAEHNLVRGRNSDTVKKELESADHYLEESLSEAEPPMRDQILQLRKEVHALQEDIDADREQARARYEQTMADLVHLIHER